MLLYATVWLVGTAEGGGAMCVVCVRLFVCVRERGDIPRYNNHTCNFKH